MAWYDSAVFYHIYPLGLCGCPHENTGAAGRCFGTLTAWADHARAIGCTALYIGPLFESGSHGYDTVDYRLVDRRLGTNEDFRRFVAHCHENGQRVIVDGVFNHVGRGFFAFQDVLHNRERSAYCGWLCDLNFGGNNEYNDGLCYGNWGGHNLLVRLNLQNPAVRAYHFDTVRFWAEEFGIDGIRLDTADVLDFGFMAELRRFTEGLKPEFWLMGEVIHGDYSRWANPGMLHAVTNYELNKGLWSGHNDHNYFEIAHTVRRLQGLCGDTRLYTFADNHDVARLMSKLHNRQHFALVMLLVYTLPGIPSVYYGSEYGIEADKQRDSDWNLRPALSLGALEKDPAAAARCALCAALGGLKARQPALSQGDYRELLLTNRQFAYARTLGGVACVTVLNCDDAPARMALPLPVSAGTVHDALAEAGAPGAAAAAGIEGGKLVVELPANSGTVLCLGA